MKYMVCLNFCLVLFGLSFLLAQNNQQAIIADHLNNVYRVSAEKIVKYNEAGEVLCIFSHRNAGHISSVDVSDPLKILVFFKDFAQIMYLDNKLAVTQGPMSLGALHILQPQLVCSSSDKGFWVYDSHNFALHKIDRHFQRQFEVQNITEVLDVVPQPVSMFENERELYLYDEGTGFYVFDNFGTYIRTLHFPHIRFYKMSGRYLYMAVEGLVTIYDMRTHTEQSFELPDNNYTSLAFGSKYIFLLQSDGDIFTKIAF